jgi:Zn-dependent protease with chaperone function
MTQYIPTPETENINAPKSKPLQDVLILVTGALAALLLLYFAAGFLGEKWAERMSPATEAKIFANFAKTSPFQLESHPQLEKFSKKLNELHPNRFNHLKFFMTSSEQINAFAYPGGLIFVTSELLKNINSDEGLAFVLGHEIGHFHNRDHLRGLGRSLGILFGASLLGLGGMDSVFNSISQNFALTSFSREQELAADDFSIELMQTLHLSLQNSDELFQKLHQKQNQLTGSLPDFMNTHPALNERLERLQKKIAQEEKTN